jgi:hypothetical protein
MRTTEKNSWDDQENVNESGFDRQNTSRTGSPKNSVLDDDEDEKDEDVDLDDDDVDIDDLDGEEVETEIHPDETPEEHETSGEGSGYVRNTEVEPTNGGNDASYSEQTDVTPPNQHEFPSVGNAKTDFVSRPYGRTTGRMVGHEPGTEGI